MGQNQDKAGDNLAKKLSYVLEPKLSLMIAFALSVVQFALSVIGNK